MCTNLVFAELDDNIRVLGIVEERSSEAISRRHDEYLRVECAAGWEDEVLVVARGV